MWAIVPVKQFHLAKQRLAPVLSASERADLFRAMVTDVLECLAATPGISRVLVVTREPGARDPARSAGADVLEETVGGLVPAVTQGARAAAAAGARGVLVVPGDLPLAGPGDLQAVMEAHRDAPAVTLVTDTDAVGTNCIAVTPADLIGFRFGDDSFRAHREAALAAGVKPAIVTRGSLALDVDTPEDLRAFAQQGVRGHAVAFLEASGIASRLRRAPTAVAHGSTLEERA